MTEDELKAWMARIDKRLNNLEKRIEALEGRVNNGNQKPEADQAAD